MRFGKGFKHTQEAKDKVSMSLIGNKRRWRGNEASYYAIHMWIKKYWGCPDHCDMCHCESASRYEWCNKDKQYKRNREDWLQLCPSCHRKYDLSIIREQVYGNRCKNGHLYTDNIFLNTRGHRVCRQCSRESQRRYRAKNNQIQGMGNSKG